MPETAPTTLLPDIGDPLTDEERKRVDMLLSTPLFFPDALKTWATDWFATNIPLIPYTQFLGARLNIAKSGNFIVTGEATASGTYTDLATVGPTISGLVDGDYLIAFGAWMSGQGAWVSRSINGAAASDDFGINESDSVLAAARADIVNLKNNNVNEIKLKYRRDGGASPTFARRWIVAVRISTG